MPLFVDTTGEIDAFGIFVVICVIGLKRLANNIECADGDGKFCPIDVIEVSGGCDCYKNC